MKDYCAIRWAVYIRENIYMPYYDGDAQRGPSNSNG